MNIEIPNSDDREPVADVVRRVSQELRDLRTVAYRIECAVGDLLPAISGVAHRDLQAIDVLGQSLECLAHFLEGTASQMPPEWQADMEREVTEVALRDLAVRLAGPRRVAPENQAVMHGECAFF